jgi:hypothetical protein
MYHTVKSIKFKSVCEFGNQRYTGPGKFISTKQFYQSLGVEKYVALDVNEEMDAVIADLNYILPVEETYDLVTNNGTGEHIFDQKCVFENAHNLSHKYILHVLPMLPWVNHGFFNYNPILFRDMAIANKYKARISIANRWGTTIPVNADDLFLEKKPVALAEAVEALQRTGDVSVVALFEKTSQEPFQVPFQGKYKTDIADTELRTVYAAG